MKICKARPYQAKTLTALSMASKRVWNYPKEYEAVWKAELTITPAYIRDHLVLVAEDAGTLCGYGSVVEVKEPFMAGKVPVHKGFWLEHLFVAPDRLGTGIGRKLVAALLEECRRMGVEHLHLFAEPKAAGFYEKLGARYEGESPSSIEGRTTPLFCFDLTLQAAESAQRFPHPG